MSKVVELLSQVVDLNRQLIDGMTSQGELLLMSTQHHALELDC